MGTVRQDLLLFFCPNFQLAKQGLNVALISRSEKKLEAVADEIRKSFVQ